MRKNDYFKKTHINGKLIEENTPVEGFVLERANSEGTKFSLVHYRKISKTNRYCDIDVDIIDIGYPILTLDDLNELDRLVRASIQMYNTTRGVKGTTSYKIRGDMFRHVFED